MIAFSLKLVNNAHTSENIAVTTDDIDMNCIV